MQAAKNMAGMIKHKLEDEAVNVENTNDTARAEVEEKVDRQSANDEGTKEATKETVEKQNIAEKNKDRKIHHERQDPICGAPTPADLYIPVENSSLPAMNTGLRARLYAQASTAPAGPVASSSSKHPVGGDVYE